MGQRFSWWLTMGFHRFPDESAFDRSLRDAELAYVLSSRGALTSLVENDAELPY